MRRPTRVSGFEKKQIVHRPPPDFVRRTLADFNAGLLDAGRAASQLGIGRTRLYQLRTAYLANRNAFSTAASGGDRRADCAGLVPRWRPASRRITPISCPRRSASPVPTDASAARTSASSGRTTARSTSGGPPTPSRLCCSLSTTTPGSISRAASWCRTPPGTTSSGGVCPRSSTLMT